MLVEFTGLDGLLTQSNCETVQRTGTRISGNPAKTGMEQATCPKYREISSGKNTEK
jgi:hypothetical protein